MSNAISKEELLALLGRSKYLGRTADTLKHKLIGNIDPLDPQLSKADQLIVLNACKKSAPFFLWLLKQYNETPSISSSTRVWGDVHSISMLGSAFVTVVTQSIERAYPVLRGKRLDLRCWYFDSGELCISALVKSTGQCYQHNVRTAPVVVERNGAALLPSGIPAGHLAKMFNLQWAAKESVRNEKKSI